MRRRKICRFFGGYTMIVRCSSKMCYATYSVRIVAMLVQTGGANLSISIRAAAQSNPVRDNSHSLHTLLLTPPHLYTYTFIHRRFFIQLRACQPSTQTHATIFTLYPFFFLSFAFLITTEIQG